MSGIAAQKRYTSSSMLSSVRTCTWASILQSLFQVLWGHMNKSPCIQGCPQCSTTKKSWCFWGCTWCSTFCNYIIGVIYCCPRFLWFRSHILPRMFFLCKPARIRGTLGTCLSITLSWYLADCRFLYQTCPSKSQPLNLVQLNQSTQ